MSTVVDGVELAVPDTTDLDRWVGVPIGGEQPLLPFHANDIRRYLEGMDNPHRLHWDAEYAAASPFGEIVAPQSYLGGGSSQAGGSAHQGTIPGSHMLLGGDETWFYGPRVFPGDRLRMDRMLFDYKLTDTAFAGPTVIARGDTTYVNQRGEFVAKERSTAVRYLVENAIRLRALLDETEEPTWTDAELEEIDQQKLAWVASFRGPQKRLWQEVEIGERLCRRPIGPHTVSSLATEARTKQAPRAWGAYEYAPPFFSSSRVDMFARPGADRDTSGWLPSMWKDTTKMALDPSFGDYLRYGPSRGHLQPRYAREIGLPRCYGFGGSMFAWAVDYLANWAGDCGFVRYNRMQFRHPPLVGDMAYQSGEVTDKWIDEYFDQAVVEITYEMVTQDGRTVVKGVGHIELPQAADDEAPITQDARVRERREARERALRLA